MSPSAAVVDLIRKRGLSVPACASGCAACCQHPPPVYTRAEAQAALDGVPAELRIIVDERLRTYRAGDPCPLLVDDRCAGYEVRPIICKTTMSPDPFVCGRRGPGLELLPYALIAVEMVKKHRPPGARQWMGLVEALL